MVPSRNYVVEEEMHRMISPAAIVATTRMVERGGDDSAEGLVGMLGEIEHAARALIGVQAIAICELAGTILRGRAWDEQLIERVRKVNDVEVTTGASAMVAALGAIGIREVAVAMPYRSQFIRDTLTRFLQDSGFKVASQAFPEVEIPVLQVTEQPPSVAYGLAKRADSGQVDGIFIASTDFRAIDVLSRLEGELHKPVVSVNQAMAWDMLRKVGVSSGIHGYGRLLERM